MKSKLAIKPNILKLNCASMLIASFCTLSHADMIEASDGEEHNIFGAGLSQSGNYALVGGAGKDSNAGAVYVYDTSKTKADGNYGEIKIQASDSASDDYFGYHVSQSGNYALVGAVGKDSKIGAAYVYDMSKTRADGNYGEIKLSASDAAVNDFFGGSVSQNGNYALVGAYAKNRRTGAVYLYDLSKTQADGNYGEIKFTASDAAEDDSFGYNVSLSGNYALVGALGKNNHIGAAYIYDVTRSQADGNYGEIKLLASDGAIDSYFGESVSLNGNYALIGATGCNSDKGAAYVYDISKTQADGNYGEIRLTASDGEEGDVFGWSVSQSGKYALVGAMGKVSDTGAAYLYDITKTEADGNHGEIKITASDSWRYDMFGYCVSADGDNFILGASNSPGTGKAYTGTISSMTTLDDGTRKVISGISFKSQQDWIIGENNSGSTVVLSARDIAEVTHSGKAVYVGKNADSNNNTLIVQGTVLANELVVGAKGNTGNRLYVANTGDISGVAQINLHIGSSLFFEDETNFFSVFDSTQLQILDDGNWTIVTNENYGDLIGRGILDVAFSTEGMLVQYGTVIPEPAVHAIIIGALALAFAAYRRRKA